MLPIAKIFFVLLKGMQYVKHEITLSAIKEEYIL